MHFNMEYKRDRFIPILRGIYDRERGGVSCTKMKEMLYGHRIAQSQSLYRRDLRGHFGCVNAIEFSTDGEFLASGGDDRRLLLWNIGQTIYDDKAPAVIDTLHISNINSCCFDANNLKVASGGNDGQVIVHDFSVRQSTAVYGLSDAIYCLSADPVNATILATASDDGKAQIIDTRLPTDTAPFVLADLSSAMHSIMYNPVDPRLLATANSKYGIGLWDIRMPLKSINFKSSVQNCMSVRFNSRGDRLLALRRRSSPVLYDIGKMHPIYEFDYKTYYNACTLKSCSFAGLKDEYVMSGSDDFCIYLWKIPTDITESYIQSEPHMILKSHRSIVNQVRYCHHNQFIISSGVEKIVKLWSPFYLPGSTGRLVHSRRYGDDDEVERDAYSHEEYIHMVLQAGSFLSHDYTNGSMDEEPCMIAFFDSLIQREIEQTIEGDDEDDEEEKEASSDENENSNGNDGADSGDGGGGDGGGGGGGRRGALVRSASDAPLCYCDSTPLGTSSAPPTNDGEDTNNTLDTIGSASSRLEDSSRPFYMDLGSSSDSDSEVDEILSAMYSRYMTSQVRAMSSNAKTGGKKISSVIAKGKQRTNISKKKACPRKLQRIREDLQHSGDQFLRDNATNMSILADVIDNFVDNLVASESNNSRTLSDTNDGHMSTDSGSNGNARENNATPEDTAQQMLNTQAELNNTATTITADTPSNQRTVQSSHTCGNLGTSHSTTAIPENMESGVYFMPELQAFSPESFNAVVTLEQAADAGQISSVRNGAPGASRLSHNRSDSRMNSCNRTGSLRGVNSSVRNNTTSQSRGKSEAEGVKNGDVTPAIPNSTVSQNGSNSEQPFHQLNLSRSNSDALFRSMVRNGTKVPNVSADCSGDNNKTDCAASDRNGNEVKNGVGGTDSDAFLAKPFPVLKRTTSRFSNSSSSSSLSSSCSSGSTTKYYGSSSSLSSTETLFPAEGDLDSLKVKSEDGEFTEQTDSGGGVAAVKFKKAKVKGRRFRVRRSESKSSSDEER